MSIVSKNEWDTLKKVIVGTATDARIPEMDLSLKVINYYTILYNGKHEQSF